MGVVPLRFPTQNRRAGHWPSLLALTPHTGTLGRRSAPGHQACHKILEHYTNQIKQSNLLSTASANWVTLKLRHGLDNGFLEIECGPQNSEWWATRLPSSLDYTQRPSRTKPKLRQLPNSQDVGSWKNDIVHPKMVAKCQVISSSEEGMVFNGVSPFKSIRHTRNLFLEGAEGTWTVEGEKRYGGCMRLQKSPGPPKRERKTTSGAVMAARLQQFRFTKNG